MRPVEEPTTPVRVPADPSHGARAGRLPVQARTLVVLGALVALSLAAFAVVKRGADREASDARARIADQAVGAIRAQLEATRADVRGVVGVFSTARTIDDFAQFAQPALANPSLNGIAWAPAVPAAMRSSFEREHGFTIGERTGGSVRPAGARAVYYPTTFVAPTGGNTGNVGIDAAADPSVAAAIRAAVDGDGGRLSAPAKGAVLVLEPAFQRGAPHASANQRAASSAAPAAWAIRPA